jgi:magnesium transporter
VDDQVAATQSTLIAVAVAAKKGRPATDDTVIVATAARGRVLAPRFSVHSLRRRSGRENLSEPEVDSERSDSDGWERLAELALASDREGLANELDGMSEADRIHAFGRISIEDRGRVLALLDPGQAADLLEAVPDLHAGQAVEELEPAVAADILEELPSNEGADLLGHLKAAAAEAILAETESDVAANVRNLLHYPPDTAGGLMITEFVVVPEWGTAQDVIDHMRDEVERYADYPVQYVYAVGSGGELQGVLPLRDLLLARRGRTVASLMVRDPVSVGTRHRSRR